MKRPLAVGNGVHALRAPEQNGDHEGDVGKQRHLRRQKAGVVGHQAHQQGPDERTARGAQPADDDDDEDEHVFECQHWLSANVPRPPAVLRSKSDIGSVAGALRNSTHAS